MGPALKLMRVPAASRAGVEVEGRARGLARRREPRHRHLVGRLGPFEHADAPAAEGVAHLLHVGAHRRIDQGDTVAVEVLDVEPRRHEHRLPLAVDVHARGEPQLPADVLRLPERDEVPHVAAEAGVGLVGVPAALVRAEVEEDPARLARLQRGDEEQLVPDAVLVEVVHLLQQDVTVHLAAEAVAALHHEALLRGLGGRGQLRVHDGDVEFVEVAHRERLAEHDDGHVHPLLVELVHEVEGEPRGGVEVTFGVPRPLLSGEPRRGQRRQCHRARPASHAPAHRVCLLPGARQPPVPPASVVKHRRFGSS